MMRTLSPLPMLRDFAMFTCFLQDLGRQRHDLHVLAIAKLAGHGAEDTGTARIALVVDDDGRILVELDIAAVGAADLLLSTDYDRLDDLALLDRAVRNGFLDRHDDGVAYVGVTTLRATEDLDAQHLPRTRVVGHPQSTLCLDHCFLRKTCRTARSPRVCADTHRPSLLGLLNDLEQTPPLQLRERTRLHDGHHVAHAALVVLV